MAILKCKMCGGDLDVTTDEKVVECEYCGCKQTIISPNDEKKINLSNRANRLRINCEFDKAAGIYEQIIAEFPEEAEAYWGLCLCNYGIEYVDDPVTANKIPTCHRASFDKMRKDENYELALENADMVQRIVYEDQAKEIDRIMGEILAVSRDEEPYDIFICYKESDNVGSRTPDSVLAQDIYDALTQNGYRVFFSRITLEDKLGTQYEPYIFSALNSAKIMLVVGTDYEYLNAVWVKNEWSRFLKLIVKDKSKVLIPCYRNMDPYDMPDEFKGLQSQDCSKLGFMQDLLRGINKIMGVSSQNISTNSSSGALTKRGYFYLEDKDFISAKEYFDRALDENPEDGKAYLGKVMATNYISSIDEFGEKVINSVDNNDFERAIRFSSAADRASFEELKNRADKKYYYFSLASLFGKLMQKKENDDFFGAIAELKSQGTSKAYLEVVKRYEDFYKRDTKRRIKIEDVKQQKHEYTIMAFLEDDQIHTLSEIASKVGLGTIDTMGLLRNIEHVEQIEREGQAQKLYALIGANERIEERKKADYYNQAKRLLADARVYDSYYYAAEVFRQAGDYLDAKDCAEECMRIGKEKELEFKAKEQERLEKERIERERIEKEKQEKIILIKSKIDALKQQLAEQQKIYDENSSKIFGSGAKLKKDAKNKIAEINTEISNLESEL